MLNKLKARRLINGMGKILGINRMTVSRWLKKGELSNCYRSLLFKMKDYPKDAGDPKKNFLKINDALQGLENRKKNFGSWQKLADQIEVDKKTIMRWRKTKRISLGYRKLLYYFFKDNPLD